MEKLEKEESLIPKKESHTPLPKEQPKKRKLTFKEQQEYTMLPSKIEAYEETIKELNLCLSDPKCYEQKGIVVLGKELETLTNEYDKALERYLELEEFVSELQS